MEIFSSALQFYLSNVHLFCFRVPQKYQSATLQKYRLLFLDQFTLLGAD